MFLSATAPNGLFSLRCLTAIDCVRVSPVTPVCLTSRYKTRRHRTSNTYVCMFANEYKQTCFVDVYLEDEAQPIGMMRLLICCT